MKKKIFNGGVIVLTILCILIITMGTSNNNANATTSSGLSTGRFQATLLSTNTFLILNTETGGFEIFTFERPSRPDKLERFLIKETEHNPMNPKYRDCSKIKN